MAAYNSQGVKDWPMSYVRACLAFGKGDMGKGRQIMFMLAKRLEQARNKHPVFARDAEEAVHVIGEEWAELAAAVAHESHDRQLDEALDVATTAMRFAAGEYRHEPV